MYRKVIQRFFEITGPEVKRLLIISVCIGLVWSLVEYSFIYVFQIFFLSLGILSSQQLKLPFVVPNSVAFAVIILLIYGIFRSLVMFFKQYVSGVIAQTYIRTNRELLFSYALNDPKLEAVHLLSSVFSERVYQTGFAIQNLAQFLSTVISLVALFGVGLSLAPIELLIGFSALMILLLPFKKLGTSLAVLGQELGSDWNGINKSLLIGLKNQYFLRIYGGVAAYVAEGTSSIRRYEANFRRYIFVNSFKGTLPVAYGILVICVITYLSRVYWERDGVTLVSFFYIFMRLAQGAGDINTYINEIRFHSNNFTDVYKWKCKARRVLFGLGLKNRERGKVKISEISEISAESIGFSYSASKNIFENLNLKVGKGQILLLKGESGVGKSTLVSVLIGLYKPQQGNVFYNNQLLSKLDSSYLDRIAYVGPEPYIVPGTIRENLLFGHHDPQKIRDEDIWEVLEQACVRSEIKNLKNELDENLYESAQLSSGQKQRISIARAFLRRPDVLIFDEATANLDVNTEALLINNLQKLKSKMIILAVSHKATFDQLADINIYLGKKNEAL